MIRILRFSPLFLIAAMISAGPEAAGQTLSPSLRELGLTVCSESREFSFTNKHDAFLYTETHAQNRNGWQGFWTRGRKILSHIDITVDGEPLDPDLADSCIVYPDYAVRFFPGGIQVEYRLVDELPIFAVHVIAGHPFECAFVPSLPGLIPPGACHVTDHIALLELSTGRDPVWLALCGGNAALRSGPPPSGAGSSPIGFWSNRSTTHVFVAAVAGTRSLAGTRALDYQTNAEKYADARRARMQRLLDLSPVVTENHRFNMALAWAKLSLDALIMNDGRKGIYAGLPWFDEYWGRDSFISLPGALLVTGQFNEARDVLRSFAALQENDSSSENEGRIPNTVNPNSIAYNTADGTPRFIIEAREYVDRSGDSTFVSEIYPAVVRSIEGTLRHRVDTLGFLTHGDAETWMDAAGPDGPWSPRGNRANDIQALWAAQLGDGVWFAAEVGDTISASRWARAQAKLLRAFSEHFIRDEKVIDHLNTDGSQDIQIRPNQIFTASILTEDLRSNVVRSVTTELTYPYGVASLSPSDPAFHPYHIYPPYYPKDEAYHNGTVWTWLQGPLISELVRAGRQEVGYRLTESVTEQILDRGAVGTQSELLDALPRPGSSFPSPSGTFSQAWNLAEFIRNAYDDYLGIRISRYSHHLTFAPALPAALGRADAVVNLEGQGVPISISPGGHEYRLSIDGSNLTHGGNCTARIPESQNEAALVDFPIPPQSTIELRRTDDGTKLLIDGNERPFTSSHHAPLPEISGPLPFLTPSLPADLAALRGPSYTLISHQTISSEAGNSMLIAGITDPVGDDTGPGTYVYPRNQNLLPGSLDLVGFELRTDTTLAYFRLTFRALSNPGWHPEYGFQLTFAAIAIDTRRGAGKRDVAHNSGVVLDPSFAFERLILVGGGVQIENDNGNVMAAYLPSEADVAHPIGDTGEGTVTFAIPIPLLGVPDTDWRFSVLVGAQDDHGGAGLGEFRTVDREAGEWVGGGKRGPETSNVYDTLVIAHGEDE